MDFQTLSKPVTWSTCSTRPSSKSTLVWLRWLALAAAAVVAVASVVVAAAVVDAEAGLVATTHPLVATAAGRCKIKS